MATRTPSRLLSGLVNSPIVSISTAVITAVVATLAGHGFATFPFGPRRGCSATAALSAFLVSWSEFLGALTFLAKDSLYTLPVALLDLQTGAYGQVDFGTLVVGSVVAMIPCIALCVALQKSSVAGLSSGAIEG